ncbi:MAG TPA: YncE family protein [Streptosporangiaceae bacterium]|jgi:YVTN family beta-propeller protein
MTRTSLDHAKAGRLLRYLAVPAGAAALALTLTAAAPASQPDAGALTHVATIAIGQNPTAMASDSATGIVYVACTGPSPDVYAIDAATNAVVATIPVATYPKAITVNSVTDTIYVASQKAGTISVIDGATNTVTGTVSLPGVGLIAADQSSNKIYADASGGIAVINGATNTVTRTLTTPLRPGLGLAVNPAAKKLYVGYLGGDGLMIISTTTGKTLATIRTTLEVRAIAADASNDVVYVAIGRGEHHQLVGLNGDTGATEHKELVDDQPWGNLVPGLAVDPQSATVFLAERNHLWQIDGKTFRKPVIVAVNAIPVAVDPATRTVYVARYGSPNAYAYHSTLNGS